MAEKNRTNSRSAKKGQVRLAIRQKVEDDLEHLQSQGLPIQSAYLLGSQVGGGTAQWSDIDKKENLPKQIKRQKDLLASVASKNTSKLTFLIFTDDYLIFSIWI